MMGNPKGEMLICPKCKRTFDILRGSMVTCACGEKLFSKEYVPQPPFRF